MDNPDSSASWPIGLKKPPLQDGEIMDRDPLCGENSRLAPPSYSSKSMSMSRSEALVACALVSIIALGGWHLYQKSNEDNPAYREMLAFSQKSPEHLYAAEFVSNCRSRRFMSPSDCVYQAIGKATYENNGEYGQAVAVAVRDISEHMTAWRKEHADEGR